MNNEQFGWLFVGMIAGLVAYTVATAIVEATEAETSAT